ncbi:MAG: 4'-phosphopantetheinyl transferase superfamily protein [Pseudanabaenaceae cyanobacterium bins.39]|nr:4'-phosphopantetheinyl transferase superfamily protein [Pseudanabaenaceae cyanobacterium bins.39]
MLHSLPSLSGLHLYAVCLNIDREEFERLWLFLSDDERVRASRYSRDKLRTNFVAARGNLRIILADWLGCLPQEVRLCYGDRGKPEIVRHDLSADQLSSHQHFNLAHSQDWAIYVVSGDRPVGIDLEFVRECDVLGLARRFFAESEQVFLIKAWELGDRDWCYRSFFRAWTLKEAYAKATGLGIQNLLEKVDVSALLTQPLDATITLGSEPWQLQSLVEGLPAEMLEGYMAAVCHRI